MRPIENLLVLANLLTFTVLAVPLTRAARWIHDSAIIALLIAGAQALVEGPRWQMVPAYALSGLFFLAGLRQKKPSADLPISRRRTNRLAAGVGYSLAALGLAVSTVLPIIIPVFRFPRPTGPYEIGTLTYHWVDADRQEIFTADPHDRRELMVQIWYPAKGDPASPRAPYLQYAEDLTSALAQVQHKPVLKLLFGNLKYITTNAIPSAPAAEDEPSYPVLIFLEGLTGFRQMNTFQVEELVSHGYIVVAIDQPYAAAAVVVFPDGRQATVLPIEQLRPLVRQSYSPSERAPTLNGRILKDVIIPYLAQDVISTLDQLAALNQADPNGILTGRLDLQHAGIFGISLGGIVGGEACRLDTRLRACLVMDAPMTTDVAQAGLQQPSMWITRDVETMRLERQRVGGWSETDIKEHQTTMHAVFESLPGDGYFVRVPGMFHINLTDIPSWSPLIRLLGFAGPIDVQRAHSIINAYTLAFFDRHLKGQLATRFDDAIEQYPEVLFETRRP